MSTDPRPALGTLSQGEPIQTFLVPRGTPRMPRIARGEGIYLWDTDGRRYIDVSSGPVVSNLGHGNRRVLDAMQAQAEKAAFAFPGVFESEANVALSQRLTRMAGAGFEQAFFVSGGSEAVESAVKFSRQHALAIGQPNRWKVISREPGYHGGTLGALSLTGDAVQHGVFGPLLREMPKVPAPLTYRPPLNHTRESYARHCADALEQRILSEGPETVLAFIMEPVGGLATGALVSEDIYMRLVREICTRHGVMLIFDEVMSGAGRTGRFLAADHWPDSKPDLVVLAKGIAAGYTPMGCVLAPDAMVRRVADAGGFMNGFTYFANPLSCAVGNAVLEEMEVHDLVGNARVQGAALEARLRAMANTHRVVGDVRGRGLLLAVELVCDQGARRQVPLALNAPSMVQKIGMQEGLALYARRTSGGAYGDWLMITPPLIVTEAQVDEIAATLARVLTRFDTALHAEGV